jgi:hypothetical protein
MWVCALAGPTAIDPINSAPSELSKSLHMGESFHTQRVASAAETYRFQGASIPIERWAATAIDATVSLGF